MSMPRAKPHPETRSGYDRNAQFLAIRRSRELGVVLAAEHPEIGEYYAQNLQLADGFRQTDIVERIFESTDDPASVTYNGKRYSRRVARAAVCEAIKLLIPEEGREEIRKRIFKACGENARDEGLGIFGLSESEMEKVHRAGGTASHEKRVGIHGHTHNQRVASGRKGGLRSKERGVGVHAMTTDQRRAIALAGVEKGTGIHGLGVKRRDEMLRNSMETRGVARWVDPEGEYDDGALCVELADQSEYQHRRGRPNCRKIAEAMTDMHPGRPRTANAVQACLARARLEAQSASE